MLTCRHVLQDLFGLDDPRSVMAASEVVATVGLGGGPGAAPVTRYLRLAPDGAASNGAAAAGGPAWDALPGSGAGTLDFALLRLDDDLGPAADWLSFREFQSPDRLAEGAAGAAIRLFMYHFPDPADGTPFIEPRLSTAPLPADWNLPDGQIGHRVASEKGSSGAMLFATVGDSRPFPIALHRGRVVGAEAKLAVALSSVLQATATADRRLYQQLSTPPAELRRQRAVQREAAPKVELARYLLDREVQAKAAVSGTVARTKRVQPVFEATAAEMELFQARLLAFDLPLRHLADPAEQQRIRCRTLAAVGGDTAPDGGAPRWGVENMGGETWLRDGPEIAVRTILDRIVDARALGASFLLTARVEILRSADYRAVEDLLMAMARSLRGPEAEADVLVLLWIGDSDLGDRQRQQGREVLRRLWGGRVLHPVVGVPVELAALAETDLGPWAGDMSGAFGVGRPEVDLAVRSVWDGLDRAGPAPARVSRHPFERVATAIDPPLQSWVQLYFRRHFETARPGT